MGCTDFFESGLDVKKRKIMLSGELSDALAADFVRRMECLNGTAPVYVHLMSPGGDYTAAMAIHDKILLSPAHVTVVVWGEASSGAAVLLQAADARLMAPNSKMLVHDGQLCLMGEARSFKGQADWYEQERTKMHSLVLDRVNVCRQKRRENKMAMEELVALFGKETIFSAEDAVKVGLADGLYQGD